MKFSYYAERNKNGQYVLVNWFGFPFKPKNEQQAKQAVEQYKPICLHCRRCSGLDTFSPDGKFMMSQGKPVDAQFCAELNELQIRL